MTHLTAKNIMSRTVISAYPETPLFDVYKVISKYNLSGIPVVDRQNKLIGIITEHDLITKGFSTQLFEQKEPAQASNSPDNNKGLEEAVNAMAKLTAKDIMNVEPLTLLEDAPLADVIRTFGEHHSVNPVPILNRDGLVVGIVSRYDILRVVKILKSEQSQIPKIALIILRLGLGLTFLWLGGLILSDPVKWGSLLQPWAVSLLPMSVEHAMVEAAILDIAIGIILFTGYGVAIVSAVAILHLVVIIITTGLNLFSAIAARDVGLIAGLAVLMLNSIFSRDESAKSGFKVSSIFKNITAKKD